MKSFLLTFAAIVCVPFSQAETTVPIANELSEIASHLKPGGVHYSLTNMEGDVEAMIAFLGEAIKIGGKSGDSNAPGFLAVAAMLRPAADTLGLLEFVGRGSSVTAIDDESWHTRFYWGHRGEKKGLLSLLGSSDQPWDFLSYAPEGADVISEIALDGRQFETTYKRIVGGFALGPMREPLIGFFDKEVVPDSGVTVSDVLASANIRASYAIEFDDERKWQAGAEGFNLPAMSAVGKLVGLEPFWPFIREQLVQKMTVEKRGDFEFITLPKEDYGEGKSMVLAYQASTGVLWLALDEQPEAQLGRVGSRIMDNALFAKAMTDMPMSGSAFSYKSQEYIAFIKSMVSQTVERGGEFRPAQLEQLFRAWDLIIENDFGVCVAIASQERGFLATMNASFPIKGVAMPAMMMQAAALGSLASPALLKARNRAQALEAEREAEAADEE